MGSVVVFSEQGEDRYGALVSIAGIEHFPIEKALLVSGNCDMDMVIIDCGHATDAGLLLLGEIKKHRPDVPVIFITDASSEEVVMRAFKSGARDFFREPVDLIELEKSVAMLLRFTRGSAGKSAPLRSNRQAGTGAAMPLSVALPERILRAMHHIDYNLAGAICLDALADEACMSKYHFCRVFKRHIGMSPMQFIASRRVEKAKQFLRDAECTISLAAFRSGFKDLSDFCRQFKKFTGITPKSYRESCHIK